MIDLTPLDVRKKRGDFRRVLRGYDTDEVDGFLEMAAERLEELVKENLKLQERVDRLQEQVSQQENREEAVREALVTAQELRRDMRVQARREAELLRKEAEAEIGQIIGEAERQLAERQEALEEMERMRVRFLKSFRSLLEREMDAVEVEEGRKPLEETPLEIDFTVKDIEARVDFSREPEEETAGPEASEPRATATSDQAPTPGRAEAADQAAAPGTTRTAGETGTGAQPGQSRGTPEAGPPAPGGVSDETGGAESAGGADSAVERPRPEARVSREPEEEGDGPLLLSSFLEEQEQERQSGDSSS